MKRRKPPTDSWEALLRLLRYRPRSCAEVQTRLEKLGFPQHEIEEAIDRGKESGLLDDRLFAKLWVEDRLAHHPLSRRALIRELEEKGIAAETISQVMDDLYPTRDEPKIALDLARTRMARYSGINRDARMRRTLNFLLRRGFSISLAREIVKEIERLSDREIE